MLKIYSLLPVSLAFWFSGEFKSHKGFLFLSKTYNSRDPKDKSLHKNSSLQSLCFSYVSFKLDMCVGNTEI